MGIAFAVTDKNKRIHAPFQIASVVMGARSNRSTIPVASISFTLDGFWLGASFLFRANGMTSRFARYTKKIHPS
jgi:hypothetical protein